MPTPRDLDDILQHWSFRPGTVSARIVRTGGGRQVLQMRVDLGVLQMETEGRPDGSRPGGAETYLDLLLRDEFSRSGRNELTAQQLEEIDREFSQFYHRRICWLAVREFQHAVRDADHTLALMDFVEQSDVNEAWSHEHLQQRGLVLFHRTQAAALAHLEEEGAEAAIEEINRGLTSIEAVPCPQTGQMVKKLRELQDWIRDHYQVDRTLAEQLADAVAAEQYERAAQLRDELARRALDRD